MQQQCLRLASTTGHRRLWKLLEQQSTQQRSILNLEFPSTSCSYISRCCSNWKSSVSTQNSNQHHNAKAVPVTNIRRLMSQSYSTTVDSGDSSYRSKSKANEASRGSSRYQNRAWELHSYGSIQDLQFTDSLKIPIINTPSQVLIKVHAASVNPIDVLMTKGYGSTSINYARAFDSVTKHCTTAGGDLTRLANVSKNFIEFPLVLGRDFSGVVQQIGHSVDNLAVGDEVFGVVGIQDPGTHADYIVTSSNLVRKKPRNLSFVEAASIPYAGLTAWSAIRITGSYYFSNLNKKKFLVLGGSGGVGTLAIQYLKNYGAYVVSTCSPDAVPLLTSLGTDFVVDYKSQDFEYHLKSQAPFDCILDLTGPKRQSKTLNKLLRPTTGQSITLSPPFLENLDKHGLIGGFLKNVNDIIWENWKSLTAEGICTKWAFFIPSSEALAEYANFAEELKIQPVVQEVLKFDSLPRAYERLEEGHARGKIVIDFE